MAKQWAVLAGMVVAALAGNASPSPPASAPPIERTPEFVANVNAAIDRGVAWLKKAHGADGALPTFPEFPGATTSLGYVTLRACGVARDDPVAKAAFASLKRDYRRADLRTYSAALYLMAIADHGDRLDKSGDEHDVKLSKDDMKWAEEIVRSIVGGQDPSGTWSYAVEGSQIPPRGFALPTEHDHSNTQYALLGLKAAARCGVQIAPEVWRKSLAHFLDVQEAAGPEVARRQAASAQRGATTVSIVDHARGWCYRGRAAPDAPGATSGGTRKAGEHGQAAYASMTAGSVGSVVICRSELLGTRTMTPKLDTDSERSIWDGLAWIGSRWQPTAILTPGDGVEPRIREAMGSGLSLYEFYAVERAGMLAGVEWMASTDWYGAGANSLLGTQRPDGSWRGLDAGLMPDDLAGRSAAYHAADTCFALLFLKKGTIPVRVGAVTGGGDDGDINFHEAQKLAGKDLEDFLDLVLARWRRSSDETVRKVLLDGATTAGARIVEPLLVRMDSPQPARRAAAHAMLRHATGLDFGYDPDASPETREEAVVRWQMWWMTSKDRLGYDPATKRLAVR